MAGRLVTDWHLNETRLTPPPDAEASVATIATHVEVVVLVDLAA